MKIVYLSVSKIHRNKANLIQTLHTVAAIQRLGIEVELYMPPKKSNIDVYKRLKEIGIKDKLNLKFTYLLHSKWKRINYAPFIWFYRSYLKRSDYIYLRSPKLSLALIKHKIPHFLEIHDSEELIEEGWIKKITEAHKSNLIRHLFPISKAAAQYLIDFGADPKRISIVPCGVDLSLFSTIKPLNFEELKNRPKVFYIGRISRDRGLNILEKIAKESIAEVHLIGEVEDKIIDHPLLKVYGFVPHKEIPKYYEKSHIIVQPYQPELKHIKSISPMKLFEAMASGRPIIISDIPPIREILIHERDALLVDPKDEKEWIDAIKRLKKDVSLAKTLSTNAKNKVKEYSWDERAKKILKVLRQF